MRPKLRTLFSFAVIIGVITILHYLHWIAPIERLVRGVFNPLSTGTYEWSVNTLGTSGASREELVAANAALEKKYQEALIDKAALLTIENENTVLREQLKFAQRATYDRVGGSVIGKDIDPLGSTILIDRGERDGVTVGDPVVVGDGILVGLVHAVDQTTATVLLIDDSQSKIAAITLGRQQSVGLIEGGFGLSIQMNFIPQNVEVKVGETVVSSGLTPGVPGGLVIGTIEAVEREAYQPFQSAIVMPAASLDSLVFVTVIKT